MLPIFSKRLNSPAAGEFQTGALYEARSDLPYTEEMLTILPYDRSTMWDDTAFMA